MFAGDAVAGYFGAMQEAELGKGFPGQRWPAAALPSRGGRAARTPRHPKPGAGPARAGRLVGSREAGGSPWVVRPVGRGSLGLAAEATLGFAFGLRAEEL